MARREVPATPVQQQQGKQPKKRWVQKLRPEKWTKRAR